MSPQRRRHLYVTLGLMIVGAIGELLTIGIIVPFLTVMAAPQKAYALPIIGQYLGSMGGQAVVTMTVMLAVVAVAAGVVRLALSWVSQEFVFRLGHDVGVRIFERMLRQPYSFYVQRNTAEVLSGVEKIQSVIFAVLLPLVQACVAAVMAIFIIALLLFIDPVVALISSAIMAIVYVAVSMITRRLLRHNSRVIAVMQTQRIQQIQEGLGGIRDILLDQSQAVFVESFRKLDDALRRSQTVNVFVGSAPRFVVESAGIVLIAFLALSMSVQQGGLLAVLPTLGALALGAQRLLPLLQLVYVGWSQYAGSFHLLVDVADLIEAPVVSTVPRASRNDAFRDEVSFADVGYTYPTSDEPAVSGLDFTIRRGEKIGFIGRTGGGKSTVLDLLMGLLEPTSGEILVDGVPLDDATRADWQGHLAHVPQFIYLGDSSIRSNIAFGEAADRIDDRLVREAAERAQAADFIEALPSGYDTEVGERGVRLSGGQRQRLGIARALYKQARVLILDEATSALDDQTEASVISSLTHDDDITIVMIAHRVSTLSRCDRVIEIEAGGIARIGTYDELVGKVGARLTTSKRAAV